jgi:hypothetical protein
MTNETSRELVERGEAAGLIRHADLLAAAEDWEELTELRDLALGSQDLGRILWPAVARAEYRLALNAPGRWAARVLVSNPGRPTFGPLPEVAASTHTWDELADHVVQGAPEAAIAAHERVVRGEDLRGDRRLDPFILEIPLALADWEPAYPLAEYDVDGASFPLAEVSGFEPVTLGPAARLAEDHATVRALLDLCTAWTTESNGRAEAVAVHGDVRAAVATLGWSEARMAEITPQQGVAGLAWAAASGGAHGRRRGMARGRFAAWWVAAALGGLLEDFPPDPSELGDAIGELRWWAWEEDDGQTPWSCRLAVEDPADGLAWVISAVDSDGSSVGGDLAGRQL